MPPAKARRSQPWAAAARWRAGGMQGEARHLLVELPGRLAYQNAAATRDHQPGAPLADFAAESGQVTANQPHLDNDGCAGVATHHGAGGNGR